MSWSSYAVTAAELGGVAATTTVVARWAGLDLGATQILALARAGLQLTVVSLVLAGVLSAPISVIAFLALMLSTASWTAAGRLKELWHGVRAAVTGVVVGAAVALTVVYALGLVEFQARYVVATSGIVIGNTMTAATLSGRNFLRSTRTRRTEVEAFFALGATPAQAHREIGQEAARESLLPNLDQTRATGLVTLPGAFVGALFGGASPATAAVFQLTVLGGVGLAMTVTAVTVTRLLGRAPYVAADA